MKQTCFGSLLLNLGLHNRQNMQYWYWYSRHRHDSCDGMPWMAIYMGWPVKLQGHWPSERVNFAIATIKMETGRRSHSPGRNQSSWSRARDTLVVWLWFIRATESCTDWECHTLGGLIHSSSAQLLNQITECTVNHGVMFVSVLPQVTMAGSHEGFTKRCIWVLEETRGKDRERLRFWKDNFVPHQNQAYHPLSLLSRDDRNLVQTNWNIFGTANNI